MAMHGAITALLLISTWVTLRTLCATFERDYRNFAQEIQAHGYGARTRRL